MSIITSSIRNSNGITYTITTDSGSDWPSVATNTFFKNLSDGIIYYKTPTNDIVNTISSSYAVTASFAISASWAPSTGGGSAFPFTGSALITGSLGITGSLSITGSTSSDLVRITQTGTGNSFVVEDSTNPDSTPFVIDNIGRVGIGITTPTASLDIRASSSAATDIAFRVRNSASTADIFSVRGNGEMYIPQAVFNNQNIIYFAETTDSIIRYSATGIGSIAFGQKASIANATYYNIAIGNEATTGVSAGNGIAIGFQTIVNSDRGIAIGDRARTSGTDTIVIGNTTGVTTYSGARSIYLGKKGNLGNPFTSDDVFMTHFNSDNSSTLIRANGSLGLLGQQAYIFANGTGVYGTDTFMGNGGNTLVVRNHLSVPSSSISSSFQLYSSASIAGNAAPHFRTEAGNIVKLYTQAAVTSSQGIADALTNLGLLTGSSVIATTPAFPFTGSALITGSLGVTGSVSITQNISASRASISSSNGTVSGSSLIVYGSGSALPVFTVQGSQGQLFTVTDSLSGSLFSVNDISGTPVLNVFSDSTTLMGNYQDPMLITTAKTVQTNSGSFVVYSLPTASYDTAFFEYSIRSGSNARAGTIMAIQSGSAVNFTETTTTDFGSTSAVSFAVVVTGSNMALTGSSTSGAWTTKCIIRGI